MAALHTVADDRAPHSLHGYFARSGDPGAPLELTVDRLRDGRSFSLREVVVTQGGRMLFRMHTSFQVADETPRYQGAAMPQVAPPEAVNFTYDAFTLQQTGKSDWHGAARPMDIRYVNPPRAPRGEPVTEPQLMWQRIAEELPDTPGLHAAGLAYLSDSTLVDSIMLPLGMRWQDEDFAGVSLDHAMWFHQPVRADEWLLFEQRPQVTGAGRGLASGCFFSRDGRLVATCQQEGLMRWTADPGRAAPDAAS
jgi:acyl-CoA thioesterase-2